MDVSKFRRSTNVRDLRGQRPPAAMTIRGRPAKEVGKRGRPGRPSGDEVRESQIVRR